MKNIYLASGSKARKEILKKLGLKFKVIPSFVQEKRLTGKLSFSALVKVNALSKAKDIAKKVKSGVIIAADTICVQEGKIFGKPRNLKDAKLMLKILSSKPQWLYSGVAVIKKGGFGERILVDYEKTKVYMDKLTDKEIDAYFKKVSPLDKAGSFDIQGKGAFFIRRIEGCFYNVVGLPVRKLFLMLKKLNVSIYFILLMSTVFIYGCSHEYNIVTGEEEAYYYSTDKEVQMGQAIARQVDAELKKAEDPLMQNRIEVIGKKIAAVSDRKEIDYHFTVLDDDEVNAFALP